MKNDGNLSHVLAGGIAGTTGAVLTCPLEVVKTRLQSSVTSWTLKSSQVCCTTSPGTLLNFHFPAATGNHLLYPRSTFTEATSAHVPCRMSIWQCLKYIVHTEGVSALFKGLSMTLLGVLPSRAIYFGAYSKGQDMFSQFSPKHSHSNIVLAAAFASFVSSTLTNPIWFVKTRLQLDQGSHGKSLTTLHCLKSVYRESGLRGFYKGIQASYFGIAETSLHFVIYEHLKSTFIQWSRRRRGSKSRNTSLNRLDEVVYCSAASIISKSTATVVCYPHEVARTRLRQAGSKYRGFFQTLRLVILEEGFHGMYKGMMTHFARQIPNTCIVLTTYESVLHLIRKYKNS